MNARSTGQKIAAKPGWTAFVFVICLILGGSQNMLALDAPNHGQLTEADYKFLATVAHWNVIELAMGHIGVQKGTDANVRTFAQRMVDAHQQAGSDLTLLATNKGANLPDIGTIEERNQFNVAKLDGAQFDQTYLEYMIADKKRDIVLFQAESMDADDSDLKAWAGKMLPVAQDDLKLAQDTYASLTVTASKN